MAKLDKVNKQFKPVEHPFKQKPEPYDNTYKTYSWFQLCKEIDVLNNYSNQSITPQIMDAILSDIESNLPINHSLFTFYHLESFGFCFTFIVTKP